MKNCLVLANGRWLICMVLGVSLSCFAEPEKRTLQQTSYTPQSGGGWNDNIPIPMMGTPATPPTPPPGMVYSRSTTGGEPLAANVNGRNVPNCGGESSCVGEGGLTWDCRSDATNGINYVSPNCCGNLKPCWGPSSLRPVCLKSCPANFGEYKCF